MPSAPSHRAIATKATIATLFAMAEADGECSILVDSEHACTVIRRKCYAHRSQLRRGNLSLAGLETSPYDAFTFPYTHIGEIGRWKFTITANETVEFELLVPEETGFDISRFEFLTDTDFPQLSLEQTEQLFETSADEWHDAAPREE